MSDASGVEVVGGVRIVNNYKVLGSFASSPLVDSIANRMDISRCENYTELVKEAFSHLTLANGLENRVIKDLLRVQPFLDVLTGSDSDVEKGRVVRLLAEAFSENDKRFSEASALAWAANFEFPAAVYTTDLDAFNRFDRDLIALVRFKQDEFREDRLNLARVRELKLEDSVWKDRLVRMASGIPILTAPDFEPSCIPPRLRNKYLRLAPAINKSIYELYKNNLIIIMPTQVAREIEGVHFSALHWTMQSDKEQGRTLADPSSGSNPLNTEAAKEVVDSVCGQIVHPTIENMMSMLIDVVEKNGSFEGMTLWKRDMAGAFTLLNILPEYVRLCAFELTDGLTMFYISGFFGHCSLPSFFNVVTRVAEATIRSRITGSVCMYVDDVCGVSLDEFLVADIKTSGEVITSLTGSKSIALHKDKSGRCIDWIGWGVDLDTQKVNVSKRNLLKCLHGFFFMDLEGWVSVKDIEKLASWCSRYSMVFPSLKPLSVILHGEHAGMLNRNAQKRLSSGGKIVCWVWRAFLILIALKPDIYARRILSFKRSHSEFRVEFDASLTGLGVIVSSFQNGSWVPFKVMGVLAPYTLAGDSSFQNTMEFLAIALSMCIIRAFGHRDVGINLIGDSKSSLSWAQYNRFKRGRSLRATLLFMRLTSMFGLQVNFAEHLPGETNIICDALSRGTTPQELGFTDLEILPPSTLPWLSNFFLLCDPTSDVLSVESQFLNFWADLSTFCDEC